jgi:hypothetical protein
MKSIDKIIVATAMLVFAGCISNPTVRNRSDTSAQLSSGQTFALLAVAVDPSLSSASAPTVAQAAQNGARDTLRGLGYTETSRENADLVFYLHGKCLAPVEVTQWGYVPDTAKFGIKPNKMVVYANHLLVAETYDNHSKQQVWMGWIQCNCHLMEPEAIQREIQRIVATFPPRNKPGDVAKQ